MQYTITSSDTTLSVAFEGNINALDLIFMNQDRRYRDGLIGKQKLFLDFSQISGSQLSWEDTEGLALLGKRDSDKFTGIMLILLVSIGQSERMTELVKRIFGNSSWQVKVFESRSEALKAL